MHFLLIDDVEPDVAPGLVVEVASPNDLADAVNAKRFEWQRAGVKLVWVVHAVHKTIHANYADGTIGYFEGDQPLTAAAVLPEVRVATSDLFRLPG